MASSQKYMTYIMPFFALTGLYWPFGLVLYWVTTNVWTLGQQFILGRRYPYTAPAAADGAAAPSTARREVADSGRTTGTAVKGTPAKRAVPTARRRSRRGSSRAARGPAGRPRTARRQRQGRRGRGYGREHAEAAGEGPIGAGSRSRAARG